MRGQPLITFGPLVGRPEGALGFFRNNRAVDAIIARWRHEPPLEARIGVPDQYSVVLYFWRIVATASVFVGHMTRPDALFDVDFSLIGRATIPTFLMISAYFTTMSFSTGGRFLKKVLKRYWILYVFFIPASVLVYLMDWYMIGINAPITLRDKFDADLSLGRILAETFYLLTFSGEYWSLTTVGQGIFSNEAVWTIDYIMGYTLLTGALYLLAGWGRIVALVVIAAIVGPTVLLLSPLWFAGVLAFEIHRHWDNGRWLVTSSATRRRRLGLAGIAVALASWIAVEFSGWGPELYLWTKTLASYDVREHLGMAKRFLWQWTYVPSLFLLLLCSRMIFDGNVSPAVLKGFRTAANYSLPVYAIHFTLMYLIQALMPDYTPRHDSPDPYIMATLTLLLSIAFGYACFAWFKPVTDRWAARIFG